MEMIKASEADIQLAKKLKPVAWVVTVLVLGLVIGMEPLGSLVRGKIDVNTSWLPPFYSSLNALAACSLIYALVQIKKKNIKGHKTGIYTAIGLSITFLLCYVLYHMTTEHTKFGGEGPIRILYFFLLNTHIVLAGAIFPFILFTFIRAYTNQIERHRKMAKWVFPIWLYVAITGPLIYLMLRPYYGQ